MCDSESLQQLLRGRRGRSCCGKKTAVNINSGYENVQISKASCKASIVSHFSGLLFQLTPYCHCY